MKNLQNLKGAQLLSKNEQLSINGGEGSQEADCEMAGGTWTCVGMSNCGCVYSFFDPPKEE